MLWLLTGCCLWFLCDAVADANISAQTQPSHSDPSHKTGTPLLDEFETYDDLHGIGNCLPSTDVSLPEYLPSSIFCSNSSRYILLGFEAFLAHLHLDSKFCSFKNMSRLISCGISNLHEACKANNMLESDVKFSSKHTFLHEAIDYTCNFQAELDWPCLTYRIETIRECVKYDVMERTQSHLGQKNDSVLNDSQMLITANLCLWESLVESCGQFSTSVIIGTIHRYFKPLSQELLVSEAGQRLTMDTPALISTIMLTVWFTFFY